jgi:predicted nucleic-acid-binding Zn-ribbon protein
VLNLVKSVLASVRPLRKVGLDIERRIFGRAVIAATVGGMAGIASVGPSMAQAAPGDDIGGAAGAAGLTTFASRRLLATANVLPSVASVTTLGYTSPGDGGGATFARASSEPQHPGKVRSADGAWWRQVNRDVDIRQFGAVGDWNGAKRTGTDNTDAIQRAIDFAAFHGGGDVRIHDAFYMIARPLVLRNRCSLVGKTDLEGGGGALIATGSHVFEMPPVGGYTPICFSLHRISIIGASRGKTDFLTIPAGGSWGWSTIEGCFIENLRHIDMLVTGVHVLNNNFQNVSRIEIRGADALFSGNYANYDDVSNLYTDKDTFFRIIAAGAIDFSHNFLTSRARVGTAPRVLDIQNSHHISVTCNQLDGGDLYNTSVSGGATQVVVNGNRFVRWKKNIPLLVGGVTDVLISHNYIQLLGPNDGFIKFDGQSRRVAVRDNLTNAPKDDTVHDFVECPPESDVSISGLGLLIKHCTQDTVIPSAGFERTYTNLGFMGAVQRFFVYSRYVKQGRHVSFVRLDADRRMIVFDRSTEQTLYDSASNPAKRFRLTCYVDGQFALEI